MKNSLNYLLLILLLSMGACSSEEVISEQIAVNTDAEITEINAIIGKLQYEESRTAVTMGDFESNSISLVWAENDTIGIYPTQGDQLSFPIVEGVGTNTCTFNGGGWALKTSTFYKAYSPFNRAYYYQKNDKLPVSMLGQKQVGNGNSDHIGKYDLQIAEGKTPSSGKISFEFQHQVCIIRMDLKAPVASTWESITLESDALFTTEATMNLSSETSTLTGTSTANTVTLDLENVKTEAGGTITAYMAVLPVNLTGKKLSVKMTDSNAKVYSNETAIIANDCRNFLAGYARWIKADDFELIDDATLNVVEAGTLSSLISETEKYALTSLKLSGKLNGTDIKFIREMAGRDFDGNPTKGQLSELDLEKATIVEGEENYYKFNKNGTKLNVVGDYMFQDCNLRSIVLPSSTNSIGVSAFDGCNDLEMIIMPEGLKTIGAIAFQSCSSLKSIEIPASVTSIGGSAFTNCTGITSIQLPENLTIIEDATFQKCTNLTSINIPKSVISIGNVAFNASPLIKVDFPDNLLSIGRGAFCSCSLTTITLPKGVKDIGDSAFSDNNNLTDVSLPEGITTISSDMFSGCSSLKNITLPSTIKSISSSAFQKCPLTEIHLKPSTPPSIHDSSFDGSVFTSCKLYIPKGNVESYQSASVWKNFTNIIAE